VHQEDQEDLGDLAYHYHQAIQGHQVNLEVLEDHRYLADLEDQRDQSNQDYHPYQADLVLPSIPEVQVHQGYQVFQADRLYLEVLADPLE
jgi:hypothetical protein